MMPNIKILKRIIRLGLPIAESNLIELFNWVFFVFIISSMGPIVIAANEVANRVKEFSRLLSKSMGLSIINHCGKKNLDRYKLVQDSYVLNIFFALCISIVFIIFPTKLVLIFTEDEAVITKSISLLRFFSIFMIIDALFLSGKSILIGFKQSKYVRKVIFWGSFLIFIPLILILRILGNWGLIFNWSVMLLYITISAFFWHIQIKKFLLKDVHTHGEIKNCSYYV